MNIHMSRIRLKPSWEVQVTTWSGRLFQMGTILWKKLELCCLVFTLCLKSDLLFTWACDDCGCDWNIEEGKRERSRKILLQTHSCWKTRLARSDGHCSSTFNSNGGSDQCLDTILAAKDWTFSSLSYDMVGISHTRCVLQDWPHNSLVDVIQTLGTRKVEGAVETTKYTFGTQADWRDMWGPTKILTDCNTQEFVSVDSLNHIALNVDQWVWRVSLPCYQHILSPHLYPSTQLLQIAICSNDHCQCILVCRKLHHQHILQGCCFWTGLHHMYC